MRREDDELLGAYVDGVTELAPDERKRIEAALAEDPSARADADATRDLLRELRAMPGEGTEPDWAMLERSIQQAVGRDVPRPWWRSWRWLVPVGALAATAGAALIWLHHPAPIAEPHVAVTPVKAEQPVEQPAPLTTVYLDGETIDVGDVDPTAIDAIAPETGDAVATDDPAALLPASDLNWIDNLDDASIDKAEHWLEGKKKG